MKENTCLWSKEEAVRRIDKATLPLFPAEKMKPKLALAHATATPGWLSSRTSRGLGGEKRIAARCPRLPYVYK